MKIFITGGTGFVGSYLTERLAQQGHDITLLTRSEKPGHRLARIASFVVGDPNHPGPWQQSVAGHSVVINLAGASIFTLWTREAQRVIKESRIQVTRHLVDAIELAEPRPTRLINASAVGYYGSHDNGPEFHEQSPAGDDFLAQVTRQWEAEAQRAESFGVSVVRCRFGIVLGKKGGALSKMLPAFKWGLGSPLGGGTQWFSWIHERDLAAIILFLTTGGEHISGAVNCTAPHPVMNRDLTQALAKALGRPIIMPPVPAFAIKTFLREFGNVVLKGQKVLPRRLIEEGFHFEFPVLEAALEDLVG